MTWSDDKYRLYQSGQRVGGADDWMVVGRSLDRNRYVIIPTPNTHIITPPKVLWLVRRSEFIQLTQITEFTDDGWISFSAKEYRVA